MNEKEMIERYIYEVIKRVPQDIREEISMELQALIEDMCASEDASVEEVLQKLGSPEEFAKRYRDHESYLIGPEYYDNYLWVLKIALIGIGISVLITTLVQGIINGNNVVEFFASFFGDLITTAINSACSAVGIITVIFAILEYQKVKVHMKPETNWSVKELTKNAVSVKSWTPNLLPSIPDKRAIISRADSVFSIIFISILAVLLLLKPEFFGAFRYEDGQLTSIACIFNLNKWNIIAPVFLCSLLASLVEQIIRLVIGYYCKAVMYSSIISNGIQIVVAFILLKGLPIWNLDFMEQIKAAADISVSSRGDIVYYWGTNHGSNILLVIICLISLIEIGVAVYKTLKYS